jgi:hypothetical protein
MRSKKKLGAVVALVAVFAVAGVAYAYWTGGGSGSGTGTAGASGTVTLTGAVADGIAPGIAAPVTLTAANATTSAILVTTVHMTAITVDAGHATCETADFTMADVNEAHEVPSGATAEALPNDGSLVYADTGVSQDACQGATLTLTLTSS